MANYVFPKVDEVKPPHSKRDLSLYKQATFSVGPLYPILTIDTLPDDWMKIRTIAALESLPMLGPVRGRWKLSFDYYFEPWSNLYGYMDNNRKMTTESIIDEYLWTVPVGGTNAISYDNPSEKSRFGIRDLVQYYFVNGKGSLLDFLGVPVGYFGDVKIPSNGNLMVYPKPYNASGFLSYVDIVRNYYVNNQELDIPFVSCMPLDINAEPIEGFEFYNRISLDYLDSYFDNLRYLSRKGISDIESSIIDDCSEYNLITDDNGRSTHTIGSILASAQQRVRKQGASVTEVSNLYLANTPNCGLFLRTYRMDLLRGIMNMNVGEYKSVVDTSAGNFDVTTLMFANKLQTLINRIDVTGGRFTDWIRTRWGVKPNIEVDRPIYLGSHSTWLDTIDVVASASGNSGDSDNNNSTSYLGQQVSYGQGQLGAGDQRPIICSMNQYGTLQCIMSLVPDVVYSQGFELNTIKTKFMDLFDPAFNQLGYQDVRREELSAFPNLLWLDDGKDVDVEYGFLYNVPLDSVVGKRVAWSEYMASLPRAHGDFAFGESLDWWTNSRVYQSYQENPGNIDEIFEELHSAEPTIFNYGGFTTAVNALSKCGLIDTSTYIYPHLYNQMFASTDRFALNWIISVRFDIEANRALGKRLMPHL